MTAREVKEIIARTYGQQQNIFELMSQRHKRRQHDIDRHYRKF